MKLGGVSVGTHSPVASPGGRKEVIYEKYREEFERIVREGYSDELWEVLKEADQKGEIDIRGYWYEAGAGKWVGGIEGIEEDVLYAIEDLKEVKKVDLLIGE